MRQRKVCDATSREEIRLVVSLSAAEPIISLKVGQSGGLQFYSTKVLNTIFKATASSDSRSGAGPPHGRQAPRHVPSSARHYQARKYIYKKNRSYPDTRPLTRTYTVPDESAQTVTHTHTHTLGPAARMLQTGGGLSSWCLALPHNPDLRVKTGLLSPAIRASVAPCQMSERLTTRAAASSPSPFNAQPRQRCCSGFITSAAR